MDGIDELKVLHGNHLLLPRSDTRSVPSLDRPPLVLDRNGSIPIAFFMKTNLYFHQ